MEITICFDLPADTHLDTQACMHMNSGTSMQPEPCVTKRVADFSEGVG